MTGMFTVHRNRRTWRDAKAAAREFESTHQDEIGWGSNAGLGTWGLSSPVADWTRRWSATH